jgi:mono/diheme cytochrome c family protein
MGWFKCDDDFITNAKVGRAVAQADDADRVFHALLCLHSRFGSGGLIPASHCDPDGLRIEASATLGRVSAKKIAGAIDACVNVGLLARDGQAIRLCGYDEEFMPECSRCHQPNPEPSHGTCPSCREKKTAARRQRAAAALRESDGADEGMPPLPAPLPVLPNACWTGQDRTGQDRKRQEEWMDGWMAGFSVLRNRAARGYVPGVLGRP